MEEKWRNGLGRTFMPDEPRPYRQLPRGSNVASGCLTFAGASVGPLIFPVVMLSLYSWGGRYYRNDIFAFFLGSLVCGLVGFVLGAFAGHALGRRIDVKWLERELPAKPGKD
jgi:hypothetical protein